MVNGADAKSSEKTGLVIWDWNGTLLDDTAVCFGIANDMRRERNLPVMETMDEYRGVFGFPVIDYYRRMGYTFETESYEAVSAEFVSLYAARVHMCPLQPNAVRVLQTLRARKVEQILLSATGSDRLTQQLNMFGLVQYFDRIVGCDDNLANGKAAQARSLLKTSGVSPQGTLFVGDTDHDFEIAKEIGCRCVLLAQGHHLPQYLRSIGATVIEDLSDVLDAVNA